jgi:hypothetical protein
MVAFLIPMATSCWSASRLLSTGPVFRGVALSILSVVFAALSYCGFWSWYRGDNLLNALGNRLDTSYAPNVSRQVSLSDPEWRPLLRIIEQYSHAKLPSNKQPVAFRRGVAIESKKTPEGEWTAPTTPIYLSYKELPTTGAAL